MPRIKRPHVKFLSLCKRGKNKLRTIYKAEDDSVQFDMHVVTKAQDVQDKGELTAVVYAPEIPDGDGDFADAETIKEMAYSYARNGLAVDTYHDEAAIPADKVFVAESFVIQKGDPRFIDQVTYDGKPVDVTGGWGVVLKIEDPELRKAYGEDGWEGISLGGRAVLVEDVPRQKTQKAAKAPPQRENHMTPEEIAKAIQEGLAPVTKKVEEFEAKLQGIEKAEADRAEALKKAAEDEQPAAVDPTDIKALKAHQAKLVKAQLAKNVDLNDPEQVATLIKALEGAEEQPERRSNQGEGALTKSEQDEYQATIDRMVKLAKGEI